jgi:hypothetical protein
MTYYILTEPPPPEKKQVLMRSVIRTRRENIGKHTEYVNDDPNKVSFTLSLSEHVQHVHPSTDEVPIILPGEKLSDPFTNDTTHNTCYEDDETLPSSTDATNDPESHGEIPNTTDALDGELLFHKILDHTWSDGILIFTAQYYSDDGRPHTIQTPLSTLKVEEPVACAKYIREYIPETRRGERPLNQWAQETLKKQGNLIRRMQTIDPTWRAKREDRNTQIIRNAAISKNEHKIMKTIRRMARKIHTSNQRSTSRNQRTAKQKNREKFGYKIPNTIEEALQIDREAGNTRWADAIKKEMDNLDRLQVFRYHTPDNTFDPSDGWQKAPLRMIFDIKNEDMRYKARLVVGGHKVDSSEHNTYSSQVDTLSVLLLFLIAQHQKLSLMTCDVSNAFPTAPTEEKVWCVAGPEFGKKEGSTIEIQRAMYGLAGSARAFADFLADCIRRLGFTPSRADPDLWIKKTEYGYDYIATHVDDLIVVSKGPQEYISLIEQEFALRNIESEPSYYLGTSLKRIDDGRIIMNSEKYIKESIRRYETKYDTTVAKEPIPMKVDSHPELDNTPLLNKAQHKEYQHIIGLGQWIVLTGRIDITYAISSLARFSSAPREGHLTMARHVLGYLKKFPKKGIVMDPRPPIIDGSSQSDNPKRPGTKDFTHQYKYFKEELDPYFPEMTVPELQITIFCDSDHGHDLITGRSITGLIAFVGSTPVYWKSKRQTSVHTSTFGAEFMALKAAVELAITLRYHLRSMGIMVNRPTDIFVDNKSVCINATNPASTLNKKSVALAYHFVRQHQAGKVVSITHIKSEDNYADILTKPLNSNSFRHLVYEFMRN